MNIFARRVLTAIAGLLLVAGCGSQSGDEPPEDDTESSESEPTPSPTPRPEEISVVGAVALGPGAVIQGLNGEGTCSAHSEYTDIKGGVQVTILDATGAVVALTELDEGVPVEAGCAWWFTVDVPAGGQFYSAQVLEWQSDQVAEADLATATLLVLPAN